MSGLKNRVQTEQQNIQKFKNILIEQKNISFNLFDLPRKYAEHQELAFKWTRTKDTASDNFSNMHFLEDQQRGYTPCLIADYPDLDQKYNCSFSDANLQFKDYIRFQDCVLMSCQKVQARQIEEARKEIVEDEVKWVDKETAFSRLNSARDYLNIEKNPYNCDDNADNRMLYERNKADSMSIY